jgi:phage-related protein
VEAFKILGKIAVEGFDKAEKEIKNLGISAEQVQKGLKVVGTAFTAAGAAGLKFVGGAREINSQLGSTAITLGLTTKEMRDLTLATTNVTFPIESVANTFDLLTKAGVRNTDELVKSANAFDALADATDSSAEIVADILIPAYKALGEELPQSSSDLDKFTWLTKNTTVELSEFGSVMNYVAMYGSNLNVSIDEMIAIMGALEAKGISGSSATRLFRTAVTQAADGTTSLTEALGLTDEEIAKYSTEIENATGLTDEHAEAMNESFGLMDEIKQKFSELSLGVGSLLTPLEPLLGIMTALGPVMMTLSTSTGAATVKAVAHAAAVTAKTAALVASKVAIAAATAAQWLWNAAMTANPIGIIIAAIGALIAAIVLIAKNWDTIRDKTVEIWNNIVGFLTGVWENITGFFKDAWQGIADFFISIWTNIADFFSGIWDTISSVFLSVWNGIVDGVKNAWDTVVNFVLSGVNWLIDKVNSVISLINKIPGVNLGEIGQIQGENINQYAQGGPILGPTLLTRLSDMKPYAIAGEAGPESVVPHGGFQTANITLNLDSRTIAQVLGARLVNDIRISQGIRS